MLKTFFSGHNKILWGAQKNWGSITPNAPRGYGPVHTPSKVWTTFIW